MKRKSLAPIWGPRKLYSHEFKVEIVHKILESGQSQAELDLGGRLSLYPNKKSSLSEYRNYTGNIKMLCYKRQEVQTTVAGLK